MSKSWDDLTPYEQDCTYYSDAYKDVYGVRPRSFPDAEDMPQALKDLSKAMDEKMKEEAEADALFNSNVSNVAEILVYNVPGVYRKDFNPDPMAMVRLERVLSSIIDNGHKFNDMELEIIGADDENMYTAFFHDIPAESMKELKGALKNVVERETE